MTKWLVVILGVAACSAPSSPSSPSSTATRPLSEQGQALAPRTIDQALKELGGFELARAAFSNQLSADAPVTLLVPSDRAILSGAGGRPSGLNWASAHILDGVATAEDLAGRTDVRTRTGGRLLITLDNGLRIGRARIVRADITVGNHLVHVIDTPLVTR